MKHIIISAILVLGLFMFGSWGFFAHQHINRFAVFTLPEGMIRFYKCNINYISDHAVDPDKRRYADTAEAPRHYLDVELYENNIDSIPEKWADALKKYGTVKMSNNGILPWQIQRSYFKLVEAFTERDSIRILIYSAYIGHYLADAHVPLHTTQNHDGQLTNQVGIHAFWESRLPELFYKEYNYVVGKATYIESPIKGAWKIVKHTHSLVDSVLNGEKQISKVFAPYEKKSYSKRKTIVLKQYSKEYSRAYHTRMNAMVEKQMRSSILEIGNFWYTAWVDAGQPSLEGF
ncbi:zinc dependent phospholipase C family protein [Pedobacter sp. JCM 36344]|uniref:zinc dependent phospholipase C family protein n=1 Tax=Pedobacter sp. JCM 36344 TaxID=3374280 RepID=UPI003978355F